MNTIRDVLLYFGFGDGPNAVFVNLVIIGAGVAGVAWLVHWARKPIAYVIPKPKIEIREDEDDAWNVIVLNFNQEPK